jgi:Ran GTPase-activating protein (RanGAP) involved in mRNA processing and transport
MDLRGNETTRPFFVFGRAITLVPEEVTRGVLGPDGLLHREMLLAPFLENGDLMRLSESASWLVGYRAQLGSLVIKSAVPHQQQQRARMAALVSQQRRPVVIAVRRPSLMAPILTSLQGPARTEVRKLRLSGLLPRGQGEEVRAMGEALAAATWPALEEMALGHTRLRDQGFKHVMEALIGGACPNLRRLELNGNDLSDASAEALAQALIQGACPRLEVLDLGRNLLGPRGGAALAMALAGGACPHLRELSLWKCSLNAALSDVAQALMRGTCPDLRVLDLSGNPAASYDVQSIALLLGSGACPRLARLDLSGMDMAPTGVEALAQLGLMSGPRGEGLEWLNLGNNPELGDAGVRALAGAWRGGACADLKELGLADVNMEREGARALAQVLKEGALPQLEMLKVEDNRGLGNKGAKKLLAAVATRVPPQAQTKIDLARCGASESILEGNYVLDAEAEADMVVGG